MRVFNTVEEMKECVGQEIGVSDWFAIDQDRINDFADATGCLLYTSPSPRDDR